MLTQDAQLVERKAQSMDPRISEFFRQSVERIDDYLPRCEEFLDQWGDRALSIGTLTMDGAPTSGTFNGSVFAHFLLERARQQRGLSEEHERKFTNLVDEVKRRDTIRHRVLQSEIEGRLKESRC